MSTKPGRVYLVGAGPGDPGLLTVKGLHLLEKADVVVFDYLSNPALLRHCPQAETIYVGKMASRHSMTQEEINALLVAKGLEGKKVVRLKGGDPFVFGRGGEECEALKNAGVGFEVVPGLTASIAGPAYAGIPVTHRDLNSSFTLITGHEKEQDYQAPEAKDRPAGSASDLDWSAIAKLPCVAFYMGVKALPGICKRLRENGMPADMPAATIQWATTSRQRTCVATISDLPEKVTAMGIAAPAITIVGRVVGLRPIMNWFETRPLFGQTVVVTRTRQQASDLSTRLEELGARVIEAPTIEIVPPADTGPVDAALRSLHSYDYVIFTSANGVELTRKRLDDLKLDARAFGRARIAAIGQVTADAVRERLFLNIDVFPQRAVAEALGEELAARGEVKGKRFLLLRADIARPVIRERLREGGAAAVDDVAVYETRPVRELPPALVEALEQKQVQWVTFTSSSTAKNLALLLGDDYRKKLAGVKVASIGPITTTTLKELGLPPDVEAEESNLDGLVSGLSKASS